MRAVRDRQARLFSGDDGMATLSATVPEPLAAACYDALERLADATATPGDTRTRPQRMVDCLYDLILRPGNSSRPPVHAKLTLVATAETLAGGDEPGEINGRPVSAAMVREVAYALGLLPRPNGSAEAAATGEESVDTAAVTTADEREPRSVLADLLRSRGRSDTALVERPEIALVDELSGQLLALTNAPEILRRVTCGRAACRAGAEACEHLDLARIPGLGAPPATDAYRPSDALDRFVRARDRRCRFPGCRARPIRCDLDHTISWPLGPTSHDNLCCLCRHHHRLSHQAPGWRLRGLPDGGLEWTTPTGQTITTHPPRFGADDELPSPREEEPTPIEGPARERMSPVIDLRTRILGRPAQPGEEPAPF